LLRGKDLLDRFIETNWKFALTPAGKKKLSFYDHLYSRYEASGEAPPNTDLPRFSLPVVIWKFGFHTTVS
jgi:hypothetical protein